MTTTRSRTVHNYIEPQSRARETMIKAQGKRRSVLLLFLAGFATSLWLFFNIDIQKTRLPNCAYRPEKAENFFDGGRRQSPDHCKYFPEPEQAADSISRDPAMGFMKLALTRINTDPPSIVVTDSMETGQFIEQHLLREKASYNVVNLILRSQPGNETVQFIDAGSNHGAFAVNAALNGAKHVYAVEPQPVLRTRMRSTFRLNGVSPEVEIYGNAVLDKDKEISLQLLGQDGGLSHIDFKPQANPKQQPPQLQEAAPTVNVKTSRLDCLPLRPGPISAMKIDVEGFELFALESAAALFDQRLVRNVFVEFGPPARWAEYGTGTAHDGINMTKKMYDRWGFEMYILPSWGYECLRNQSGLVRERHIPKVSSFLHLPRDNYHRLLEFLDPCNELFVWWSLRDDPVNRAIMAKYAA